MRDHSGETEDGRHGSTRLLQHHCRLGIGEMDRLGGDGPLEPVVVAGRPCPGTIGRPRVVVGFVHRLPASDQVAKGLRHVVDVPRPYLGSVAFLQEAAAVGEPTRQREVVQAHPRLYSRLQRGCQDLPVVRDGAIVVPTRLRLDPGPLDREPVVPQAEFGKDAEVLLEPGGEAVPRARGGRASSPFPIPPVRRGCRSLALGGRGGSAPHEAVGPAHATILAAARPWVRPSIRVGGTGP